MQAFRPISTRVDAYAADRRGSIAAVYAIILATVVGLAGLALDYARAVNAKNQLQAALDTAVLAAVVAEPSQQITIANAFFDLKRGAIDAQDIRPVFRPGANGTLEGTAAAAVETTFGALFGIEEFSVASKAVAGLREVTTPGGQLCVLVNDRRAPQALLVNSGARILAPNCEVHVRSLASPAAIFNAGAGMSVQKTCLAGASIINNGISSLIDGAGLTDDIIAAVALYSVNTHPVHDVRLSFYEQVISYTVDRKPNHAFVDFVIEDTSTGGTRTERERIYYTEVTAAAGLGPNTATSCAAASDPYVFSMPAAPIGPCKTEAEVPRTIDGGAITLRPGTYCGTYNFNAAPTVTFEPGLYVIVSGQPRDGRWVATPRVGAAHWNVNGGVWRGEGVTIYFADSSSIQFNSAVDARLSAPEEGPYAHIVMYEAPDLPLSNFVFNDSKSFIMTGIVYLPSRDVTFNSGSQLRSRRTMLVVNTLIWNGTTWDLLPMGQAVPNATGRKEPALLQ